jgi:hypothetical protein
MFLVSLCSMKLIYCLKGIWIVGFILLTANLEAQQKISFDLAAIRRLKNNVNGINVSSFYHFNDRLSGGIEVNRIFPVNRTLHDEKVQFSSWDVGLNFHYLLSIYKNWKLYPITGISHYSEKEWNQAKSENLYERFWTFNTGAGVLWQWNQWAPHIEGTFAWGRQNLQIILAGISYELESGHHHKEAIASRKIGL